MTTNAQSNLYDIFKKVKRQGNYRREIKKLAGVKVKEKTKSESIAPNAMMNLSCTEVPQIDHLKCEVEFEPANNEEDIVENWIDEDEEECDKESMVGYNFSQIQQNFYRKLSEWCYNCNPTQHQIRQLLVACNETLPFELPRDPRTIMKTPRSVTIIQLSGGVGQYWHHGLIDSLQRVLQKLKNLPPKISLNINADGLPIAESSNAQFWPLLCNLYEFPHIQPIVIGIYCGKSM